MTWAEGPLELFPQQMSIPFLSFQAFPSIQSLYLKVPLCALDPLLSHPGPVISLLTKYFEVFLPSCFYTTSSQKVTAVCINRMETQPLYAAGNTWESKTLLRSWTFWTTSAQLGIDSHPSLHPFYCTVCYKTFQALLCGSEATAFAQQCWVRVQKDTQSTIFTWSRR